jgi:hypothetical protein
VFARDFPDELAALFAGAFRRELNLVVVVQIRRKKPERPPFLDVRVVELLLELFVSEQNQLELIFTRGGLAHDAAAHVLRSAPIAGLKTALCFKQNS